MNVWLGRVETAFGEAECAVTQTVHFKASVALEWWCATSEAADQNVNSRHSSAIFFEVDFIAIALGRLPHEGDFQNLHWNGRRFNQQVLSVELQSSPKTVTRVIVGLRN